jgi:hypothetical protein
VEPAALPRLVELWPELATTPGVTAAECVYPQAFWDFIHATGQRRPCALAYVLGQPDRFGVFGSDVCTSRNHCPSAQRHRCEADVPRRPALTEVTVRTALDRRGHADVTFTLDRPRGEVVIDAALPTSAAAALTHDLGVRVRVARQDSDPYWSSGTAGALLLVVGDAG